MELWAGKGLACLLIARKGVTDQSILVAGRQGRAVWGQEKRPWRREALQHGTAIAAHVKVSPSPSVTSLCKQVSKTALSLPLL